MAFAMCGHTISNRVNYTPALSSAASIKCSFNTLHSPTHMCQNGLALGAYPAQLRMKLALSVWRQIQSDRIFFHFLQGSTGKLSVNIYTKLLCSSDSKIYRGLTNVTHIEHMHIILHHMLFKIKAEVTGSPMINEVFISDV